MKSTFDKYGEEINIGDSCKIINDNYATYTMVITVTSINRKGIIKGNYSDGNVETDIRGGDLIKLKTMNVKL